LALATSRKLVQNLCTQLSPKLEGTIYIGIIDDEAVSGNKEITFE